MRCLSIETRQFARAKSDLDAILSNPGLMEHLRTDPSLIHHFHQATGKYLASGQAAEGRAIARAALNLAKVLKQRQGESHYHLAAYALSSRTDREFVAKTVQELAWAFEAHQDYRRDYARDEIFNPIRSQIDAAVSAQIFEYRRLAGRRPARTD